MQTLTYQIPSPPSPSVVLDSTKILRALARAHLYLAEFKGSAKRIPLLMNGQVTVA